MEFVVDLFLPVTAMVSKIKKSFWISVKRKVPDTSKEVLVHAPDCSILGPILLGSYFSDSDSWTVYDFHDSKLYERVTHWMPLPEAP